MDLNNVIVAWWASETKLNPNRKSVVNHMFGGGVYTTLMESRVFILHLFFLALTTYL
jgi:hypothetical protein